MSTIIGLLRDRGFSIQKAYSILIGLDYVSVFKLLSNTSRLKVLESIGALVRHFPVTPDTRAPACDEGVYHSPSSPVTSV